MISEKKTNTKNIIFGLMVPIFTTLTVIFLLIYTNTLLSYFPNDYKMIDTKNNDNRISLSRGNSTDHIGGNFILDITKNSDIDSTLFVATGDGLSVLDYTDLENITFRNTVVGHGGISAMTFSDNDSILWMTTATDTFPDDAFLQMGTGVHKSTDHGVTWTHYEQPGITPIQGLTYDITTDSLGTVWMACFGQSLQRSIDYGETFTTVWPGMDSVEWSPALASNMNQRMFAAHHSKKGKLWVGSADGIHLCNDYSVADTLLQWTNSKYPKLTGNFVTNINSQLLENGTKEMIWVASWRADSDAEIDGISFTDDDGKTWSKALQGEKVYSFAFDESDVFVCSATGLWKSKDLGQTFEKYDISVFSELKDSFIDITKVYSFYKIDGVMWLGTGYGLAYSTNEGNDWLLLEAYKDAVSSSANETYAFPNPFSPERSNDGVKIQFNVDNESPRVKIKIYNFAMEKVITLEKGRRFEVGNHYITWDGKDECGNVVANGVYFYIISVNGKEIWNKIMVFD